MTIFLMPSAQENSTLLLASTVQIYTRVFLISIRGWCCYSSRRFVCCSCARWPLKHHALLVFLNLFVCTSALPRIFSFLYLQNVQLYFRVCFLKKRDTERDIFFHKDSFISRQHFFFGVTSLHLVLCNKNFNGPRKIPLSRRNKSVKNEEQYRG